MEEEDETNENVRAEEGPVMIHIGYTNKDYNPDQVINTTNSHLIK